jgi:predicted DNA-binding transcriptional regulator AlpA
VLVAERVLRAPIDLGSILLEHCRTSTNRTQPLNMRKKLRDALAVKIEYDQAKALQCDPFATKRQVLARYGFSDATLYRWIADPEICFPRAVKLGHQKRAFRWRDLAEFDARRTALSGLL